MSEKTVQCDVCFRRCRIPEGKKGACQTKQNENGRIVDLSAGKITSAALDPIEKKPLYHFCPGKMILSFGSYGCSMRCPFCQNWEISQEDLFGRTEAVSPEWLVEKAQELKVYGNIGLAATYNEPMLNPDFLKTTFELAKEKGLKTVIVTSGAATLESLGKVLPVTDAFNIDLKGFSEEFYKWAGGDFETVKAFIQKAACQAHVELTVLVIPGKNDSEEEMEEMAKWIAGISPDIPLHLSRYFPQYKCRIPMTPKETLYKLKAIAEKHLNYVYLGNVR
ncbi:MAG: AmmeMemoRadiSam system radical SAM enzyme [Erysipelotrichaceae bacterium]|nr:AmmeMemoRadiSam system radical SAM enzyme [Erysipelotrichaceae bacterium]